MTIDDKTKEKFKKAEHQIDYGPSSMSVSCSVLANDKKIKEISEKIQKIWNANVRSPDSKPPNKKEKEENP